MCSAPCSADERFIPKIRDWGRSVPTDAPARRAGGVGPKAAGSGEPAVFLSQISSRGFAWSPFTALGGHSGKYLKIGPGARLNVSGHCCLFRWWYRSCAFLVFVSNRNAEALREKQAAIINLVLLFSGKKERSRGVRTQSPDERCSVTCSPSPCAGPPFRERVRMSL